MEESEPDFSVEVESLEEEPDDTMPKIIPRNVPLVAKPVPLVANPVPLVTKPVPLVTKPVPLVTKPVETPDETSFIKDSIDQKPTASHLVETIEIENPTPIFSHIDPYPLTSPKQHHFYLKHKTDRNQLIDMWNQIGITAELNESGKNNVDVTLTRQGQLVGKIQFLHFDRRDRGPDNRSKHYVKLYLYQFDDSSMFEKAKQILRDFFGQIRSRSLHSSPKVRRSPKRTSRTKRTHRKKAHSTRKHKKPVQK
jgi:hypothetical protein